MGWNIRTEEKDASEKEKRDWHVWQGSSLVWKKSIAFFVGLAGAFQYG